VKKVSEKKHFIIIDGVRYEVSREVYKAHRKYNNHLKYSEYMRKTEKVKIDENGKITINASAEDSVERLEESNKQFPDAGQPSIQDYIEMKIMLDFALKRLPEDERRFIELHYFKGFGINELSTIFNVPIRALYKKRDKILCKLNEYLSE
jgi:DNA-directed RNA polymerase specialized sigma24 family protein